MRLIISLSLLSLLISCGKDSGGGDGSSSSATITALKASRAAMAEVSKISSSSKMNSIGRYFSMAPGTDLDNSNWSTSGTYEYEDSDSNTFKEFFAIELDSTKAVGSGRSNLLNRLDEALLVLCAFSIDFGDDLTVTTGKTMSVTATAVNSACGTKLHAQQISFTGGTGVVEDVSGLSGSQFEKKITITDNEGPTTYYLTNSSTELKYAFGATDSESNERVIYSLNKSSGDFTFEYVQGSKDGGNYPYHYRAIKSGSKISVVGRVSHGDGVEYFLTMDTSESKAAIDFKIDVGGADTLRSVCVDTSNATVAAGGFAACFTGQPSEEYSSFSTFFGIDMFSSTTWTSIDHSATINFSTVSGMNTGL